MLLPGLGHPLVDAYLEVVAARLRPNSVLAVAYDLKVFFTVIDLDPLEVRRRDVIEFIRAQRTGGTDGNVIAIDDTAGMALSTVRRRLSSLSGFYAHLVALDEMDHNPRPARDAGPVAGDPRPTRGAPRPSGSPSTPDPRHRRGPASPRRVTDVA